MPFKKPNSVYFYLSALVSCLIYIYFAYFLDRTDFTVLIALVSIQFLSFYVFIKRSEELDFKVILSLSILFRLLFLFSIPLLSDDIYRFIWDGYLWQSGINPFSSTPQEIINMDIHIPGISQELYSKLNSKAYFSIYPPFNQLIFYLSTLFSVDKMLISIVFIRVGIIAAEIGSIYLLKRLIENFKLPTNNIALYALNPLVIIELTGNLHFEVWMIFFLLLSIYLLIRKNLILSAICMSLAISSKIWPLMFLPLLFGKLQFKELMKYYLMIGLFTIISFALILDIHLLENFLQSVNLYFQNFEFNASLFYIGRAIGFYFMNYDPIQTLGPVMSVLTFIFIMTYSFINRNEGLKILPQLILMTLSIYLLMSSVVHPWYICPLIAFAVLTDYKFPLIWSFVIFLSYFAYSQANWQESMILIGLEYIVVLIAFIWDINGRKASEIKLA